MMNRLLPILLILAGMMFCSRAQTGQQAADEHQPVWMPVRPLYGGATSQKRLQLLTQSSDPHDRARSAFLLGLIGDCGSAEKIAGLLKDSERTVRVNAGLALGFLGDERGIHVCDAVLRSDMDWMRYYAVCSLWYMNTPRAKAVLKRNLSHQHDFIAGVIRDSLKTPFVALKEDRSSIRGSQDKPQSDDLWSIASDAFIVESDQWWHKGDYNQTIRCHETALFFDPAYAEGYSLIAWLQWSMGDDATAIRTLKRGIEALPENPETYGALGQHYWLTKRYALAEEPLRKAIELGGDHLIRRPYALSLEKLGKIEESLAQWEVIVKERPNDPAAPMNVERLSKKLAEH